jgi:hypothetical protein
MLKTVSGCGKTTKLLKFVKLMEFVNRLPLSDKDKNIFLEKYILKLKQEDVEKEKQKKYYEERVLCFIKKDDFDLSMLKLVRS